MANRYICAYNDCKVKKSADVHLFQFPINNSDRCDQWLRNCGNMDLFGLSPKKLSRKYICNKHFRDSDFTNYIHNRLLKNAIPLPFNALSKSSDSDSEIEVIKTIRTYHRHQLDVLPSTSEEVRLLTPPKKKVCKK